ncbi:23S rRNA (adenine(1618)-N(6))-methyltransferase RlmF [Vibrio astriarenae]|uniref:Ribosomal RNA large subunit methyltransferase F n=1 Tax=Vibrio astriarenae TaxID=1481923 RepID=A0A7Z2T2H9_9VIBR|nr:23S rRNA (adenine(1618)-N(6))-methyltransferase RlmF [Vibrio astriarenae]QIA63055.1 23S rRNA (adenine(1618)-N(6))-methyltransferase RlmF [Vibrio astriarenae]
MSQPMKFTKIATKSGLHPRNQHKGNYDLQALTAVVPELKQWLVKTPKGTDSIDFSSPQAVKLLNKALLAHHYGVLQWDIPEGYLCPPIPGRADYIHRVAELLQLENIGSDSTVKVLDIGTGANIVYPMIGVTEYQWQFTASDIDPVSIECASTIANSNSVLSGNIEPRLQANPKFMFKNIIRENEYYHVTVCNPPFHKSLEEASKGTQRKLDNLSANQQKRGAKTHANKQTSKSSPALNFGGQKAELWCPGGEAAFLKNMAHESQFYAEQVAWFTSLVSKKENVRWMRKCLEKAGAKEARVIEMSQGQKKSRFVAWTFN